MDQPDFLNGDISTHFIQDKMDRLTQISSISEEDKKALAILSCLFDFQIKKKKRQIIKKDKLSCWKYENRKMRLSR